MQEELWLIDEIRPLDGATIRKMERELPTDHKGGVLRSVALRETPNFAIRVHDITIHDNKKWFGETEIRLDALVVHGKGAANKPDTFYMPQTFRFPRVADGDHLPIDDAGLLIFYGQPLYFLDIFITVSRNRKDSDDLATLLSEELNSQKIQGAVKALLALAVAAPQVAAITAAVGAAAILGSLAYQVLRQVTGDTIGLYRTSWLQHRDRFGLGRHPEKGVHNKKDLSFWYEIVIDEPPDHK